MIVVLMDMNSEKRVRERTLFVDHALAQRADSMYFSHGSVPFVVVIGLMHPYLNTGQTLTANSSTTLNLDTPTAIAV